MHRQGTGTSKHGPQGPHLRPSHSSAEIQAHANRIGHDSRWRRPFGLPAGPRLLDDSLGVPGSVRGPTGRAPVAASAHGVVEPAQGREAKCRWNKTLGTSACRLLEATPGIEPGYTDLQSAASPLRHVAIGLDFLAQLSRVSSLSLVWNTTPQLNRK